MILAIIIFALVYILSIIKIYWYIKISYSKDGQWSNIDADFAGVFFTLCPIVNTIFALMTLFESPYREGHPKSKNFNKFFKVKK